MRDQGQIVVLGVGMPHWAVVLWANAADCDIEKVPEIYSFVSCCDTRKMKSHTYL
jgi:hypothetical protein